jgi:cytochrome c-type biogenesis protein CcmH/NrfF
VRGEIDRRVTAGLTDEEIKSDLIHVYGHGILLEPEGLRAVAAYTGPSLAFVAALLVATLWVRRLAGRPSPAEAVPFPAIGRLPEIPDD